MKDTLPEAEDIAGMAVELGKLLSSHNGGDVAVMDMRELNFWTDFFVIATVTSITHQSGLERHVKDFSRDKGLPLRRSRRPDTADEWCLLDLGTIVVHLMTSRSRSFYELERLWSSAPLIYDGKDHSSKSS
ncbi:MAG: ribosome silencing factor [Treponema sp.]|jgi:ribosome-associated protein|nr:ribosome silencing factor [Treponema sp.]